MKNKSKFASGYDFLYSSDSKGKGKKGGPGDDVEGDASKARSKANKKADRTRKKAVRKNRSSTTGTKGY